MKRIPLDQLRQAPGNLWHDALRIGVVVGGVDVEVPDDFPLNAPALIPSAPRAVVSALANRVLAVPESQWPFWAKAIARRRQPGDTGLGDTLERVLRRVAADQAAQVWERWAGKSCGCKNRQAWLNGKYKYPSPAA
jgi:hypothetical protein